MTIEIHVAPDAGAAGRLAAEIIRDALRKDPGLVLGVATGGTPRCTYEELVRSAVDLSSATLFLLDEYVGLDGADPRTCRGTIRAQLTGPLGIDDERINAPDVDAVDLSAACARYEADIDDAGGIALQLLGIGRNGHIGFNEPGSSFESLTRLVQLADTTISDNSRFFGSPADVPTHAVTQGIATVLRAGHLLLLANGASKAEVLSAALTGPTTPDVPASALQLHGHVTVIADAEAAARL